MAENKEGQEKSESASAKRLSEARDRGQVAKSPDVTIASTLLIGGLSVYFMGKPIIDGLLGFMKYTFINAAKIEITDQNSVSKIIDFLYYMATFLLPVLGVIYASVLIGEIAQVKFHFASKKFTEGLNFAQIFNPFSGLKKIFFSSRSLVELLKSFLKLLVLGIVTRTTLDDYSIITLTILEKPYQAIGELLVSVSLELLIKFSLVFAVLAAADYFYQKWKFGDDMKMTKQEVKEETKQMMGDPKVKARFRSLMMGRIRSAMMKNIKKADVVITNPTHFAVAVQYDSNITSAPFVVAKGADFMAKRIKEEAKKHGIPIVENPPLARTIYFNVDVNREIPETLFKTVAEVLAYVYSLKGKRRIS
jgi:flagellar biosynthetic protein FlhB